MKAQVEVKKSKTHGKGVFALKNFKKGEIVIHWNPKPVSKDQLKQLSEKDKTYIHRVGKKIYLMQSPEKFVNHSFNPNTKVQRNCDVAKRLIKRGEEITTRYNKEDLYFLKHDVL